jgi:hypothetical protein
MSRLGDGVRTRTLRASTSNLERAVVVVVVLGHVVAVLLCLMIVTGWRGPSVVNTISGSTYWPWQALITVAALGVITVALSIGAVRSPWVRRVMLSATAVILTLFAMDALPLGPARLWLVGAGIACTAVALVLPPGRPARETLRCTVASAPFLMAFIATARSTDIDQALAAIRSQGLIPSAAILLSLVAIFAVASSVEEQRERTGRLLAWRVTRQAVLCATVLKLVLLGALYLHLTGGFLGGEPFWRPRLDRPLSWLHAAIVAGLILLVALRSWRRPLAPAGFSPRLAVVSFGVGIMQVCALVALVVVTVVNAVSPTTDTSSLFTIPNWVIDHVEMVQLVVAAAILLAALAELAVRRSLTSGLYLWLAAGTWLVPALLGVAFASDDTPAAWAVPGQVEAVLTVAVLAVALSRRPAGVQPRTLMMLIVVPFVVLHLDSFWPDAWMDHVTQIAVVAAVVIALWLNPPPVYADRRRNERSRALLVAGQLGLLTLYLYLLTDADIADGLGSSTTIAWLWLGVPLTAVLTARVARVAGSPSRSASLIGPTRDPDGTSG